jgi:hypothetical protein
LSLGEGSQTPHSTIRATAGPLRKSTVVGGLGSVAEVKRKL